MSKTLCLAALSPHSKETNIWIFCHAQRSRTQGGKVIFEERPQTAGFCIWNGSHATYGQVPSSPTFSLTLQTWAHGHFHVLLLFWMLVKKKIKNWFFWNFFKQSLMLQDRNLREQNCKTVSHTTVPLVNTCACFPDPKMVVKESMSVSM